MRKNPHTPFKIDSYFDEPRSYGFHDGWDTNGLGGGNTDMDEPLFPLIVNSAKAVFTSYSSTGWGRILVYSVETPRGTRWIMYAHLNKVLVKNSDVLSEDKPIALMGSTGKSSHSHLHWRVFKKKPTSWRMVAKTKAQLHEYFIDPIEWFEVYGDYQDQSEEVKESDLDKEKRLHEETREKLRTATADLKVCKTNSSALNGQFVAYKDGSERYIEQRFLQLNPPVLKYSGQELTKKNIIELEIQELIDNEDYKSKWLKEVDERKKDLENHKTELKKLKDEIQSLKNKLTNLSGRVDDKIEDTEKSEEKVSKDKEVKTNRIQGWIDSVLEWIRK